MQKRIFTFLFSVCFFAVASAQTTQLSGKVYNAATNEAMPFVSIIGVGTTQGTVSDIDGDYTLTITGHVDSIKAVYVAYKPTELKVKQGTKQILNIGMVSADQMAAVDIHPGENPAITILKQVYKHKDENDKVKLDAYQYEVYNKLEFDLNNITPKMENSKMMKPVKFIFDNID